MIKIDETSSLTLKGELFIKLIDESTNEIIYEEHQNNLIVDNGLLVMAGLLIGDNTNYEITQIAFGDSTTIALSSDQDLQGDYYRKIPIGGE